MLQSRTVSVLAVVWMVGLACIEVSMLLGGKMIGITVVLGGMKLFGFLLDSPAVPALLYRLSIHRCVI